MFSITLREQFLVAGVLAVAVLAAAIKYGYDARREAPAAVGAPTPGQFLPP